VKTVPHQHDAEAAILGAILLRPETAKELPELLPEHFHRPAHRAVYAAMVRLSERGESIDLVSLGAALRAAGKSGIAGGLDQLSALADTVATYHGAADHARLVIQAARLRSVREVAARVADEACDPHEDVDAWVDGAEKALLEVSRAGKNGSYRLANELVRPTFERLIERAKQKSDVTGVPTRYVDLDALTGGLQPSDLVILAARPSMGKTALALNLAQNLVSPPAGNAPIPVLFFSLEMSATLLIERLITSEARVDSTRLRAGKMTQIEMAALCSACDRLNDSPLAIDDTSSPTVLDIAAGARRWRSDRRIWKGQTTGLIVVDYIGLVRAHQKHHSTEQEVAAVSRNLKAMAKELEVPVLALSQLNRGLENRADKRPQLSDLRMSGAIEQDADVVMFVHRPERFATSDEERAKLEGQAEIIVGKARNGPTGTVHMTFIGRHTRFESAVYGGGHGNEDA
jgi:replicative DNA helicase